MEDVGRVLAGGRWKNARPWSLISPSVEIWPELENLVSYPPSPLTCTLPNLIQQSHSLVQVDLFFLTESWFSHDTPNELYYSVHLSHLLGLFFCITHSQIFHVTTLTCRITSPSLIICTISPLVNNTLPHLITLDHSQQHSHHSKTSSLSPCRPHPVIAHHPSFTVDLSPSNCLIPLPNNKFAKFDIHFLPLHFAIPISPLHDHRFQSTALMLQTNRSLKNPSHTHPT